MGPKLVRVKSLILGLSMLVPLLMATMFFSPKIAAASPTIKTYKVQIGSPYGITTDQSGHVWVTGIGTSEIIKLSQTGATLGNYWISNYSGGQGIAIDHSGNVWVTNASAGTVIQVSPTGTTLATLEVGKEPVGVAVDADGNVWTVNEGSNNVTKIHVAPTPSPTGNFDVGPSPTAIAMSSTPYPAVWVTNSDVSGYTGPYEYNNSLSELSQYDGWTFGTYYVPNELRPEFIATDANGNVWVSGWYDWYWDGYSGAVVKFSPKGTKLGVYSSVAGPWGIACDSSGDAWVADSWRGTVTELSPTGKALATYKVGGNPQHLAVDKYGNVWVTGTGPQTVTEIAINPQLPNVSSISASPSSITLSPTQDQQLSVKATMSDNSTQDVTSGSTFSSSNSKVATVSASGLVTAVALGNATITVTYKGRTAQVAVTVINPVAITTSGLPDGMVGVLYSATLAATGGTPPYDWTATGLPAGLNIGPGGVISGTPAAAGTYQVTVKVTDQANVTVQHTFSLTVKPAPTALTLGGSASGDYDDPATVTATLTNNGVNPGVPVPGVTLTLTLGSQTWSGTTGADGVAVFQVTPNEAAGKYALGVTFKGNSNYLASTANGSFTVDPEETSLSLESPPTVANGGKVTLFATLTEDGLKGISGRTVTFTLGSGSGAQTMTGVTDASGKASCTIDPVNQSLGPDSINVHFAGDPYYLPASARSSTLVFAYLHHGAFVIGDQSVAGSVYFWGARWSQENSLSGGQAPASFKGFAAQISIPPTAGSRWTTRGGNSSGPPDSLPSYMAVVVSGSITKSGATISGDIRHLVVVKTDGGYASNPGHAGRGTVVTRIF